ncbi:MAG: YeeE/YedE family protein [Proteobacteria bacterium]|nr:YeeE/YedE family protein [Pseudomonadota bacterium]MBU1709308.1 YeeE/YedE family protein [Pseudomonadota bacterium]
MNKPEPPQWSPYLAGALVGVLIVISAWTTENFFGASTSFVRTAGMLERIIMPERIAANPYFRWITPTIDWQLMFVIGIFFGSLVSALTSKTFRWQAIPDMWKERFGTNTINRGVIAFAGGAIAMFGARLAGGCPSGHGLSGTLQLGISGFITLAGFFIGGIIMARIIYSGGKK